VNPLSILTTRSERARAFWRARRYRVRRALPATLLLASVAAAGVGAVQAYQAQRSHHVVAKALLREYGSFAAFLYLNHLDALFYGHLKATLGPLQPASPPGTAPGTALSAALAAPRKVDPWCDCYPSIAGTWAFHLRFSAGDEPLVVGSPKPDPARTDEYLEAVSANARTKYRPGLGIAVVPVASGREERLLAYTRIESPNGDTAVSGVELDPAAVKRIMATPFQLADLLPPSMSNGRSNEKLLVVRIISAGGTKLFDSDPSAPMDHAVEERIYPMLGGGTIQASVLPKAADWLIIGGLPRNRLPILLTVFGLAGLLALLAAAQMRKEDEFSRLRSDFVASVSHELRTPLAQVRLFVETLRLGRAHTEEQKEWALGTIDRETHRLTQLVENILHFSRAERGLGTLELEPADLSAECREAAASFLPLLRAGQAELACSVPPGLTAGVHRDSFRQVLLNLLDNAVKYGPAGQTVRIVGSRTDHAVRIAVEDQGPGVPLEERELVWDAFRRGASAVGTVAAGSGIGLSVVREIVRAHNGKAWIEDAAGGGARFVVELPAVETAP
jgi:signal transduction histidine kinase